MDSNTISMTPIVEPVTQQDLPSAPLTEDPSYFSIEDLPSTYFFYTEKVIMVRPLRLSDCERIYYAVTKESVEEFATAINRTISNFSIFDLTEGDFNFFLYWLRLNSYQKSNMEIEFTCSDKKHTQQVVDGVFPADSLDNKKVLRETSDLQVNCLGAGKYGIPSIVAKIEEVKEKYGIMLHPPTMRDVIDFQKLADEETDHSSIEFANWVATNLSRKVHGDTLAQRREVFNSIKDTVDPDFMYHIDEFDKMVKHGIVETLKVPCSTCKAVSELEVSVDMLTFFPFRF